ncbi:MAG TPA: Rne/Rng family ribonuclease [Bacteroidota bacterium]|jgi:ribonuclease G|nr:Rne/Rng family ribonuclease [Bacteroidota bacterium]
MKKEIIINSTANENRIAILEDGNLAELFVDIPGKERNVGDIYLGRVAKVMPGIRAVFVDIGHEQDAFLHFSDIGSVDEYSTLFEEDEAEETEEDDEGEHGNDLENGNHKHSEVQKNNAPSLVVEEKPHALVRYNGKGREQVNLQKGQEILVQIIKEPVGKKGVRVRSAISLPGRFLVLIPFDGRIGVSKKISSFKEKRRLRRIVRGLLPKGFGAIIRTVAEGKSEELLKQDLDELIKIWQGIEKAVKTEKAPALIYKDLNTTSSVIRDLFQDSVERVVVDGKKLYKEIRAYVQWMSPDMVDRIEFYKGDEPIFDKYGIEKDIETLFSKKVWLKSGGYLYIERTEAMTVIDVNSGRYAAKKEQELNSLRTDLEAAREICRQIRLRDIGGLIIIDFIDLDDEKNRKKIYDEVKKELRKDRAKVTVLPLTEFGLMQITRQRIRQNVQMSFSEPCPMCGGTGIIQSKSTTMNQIERWIRRFKANAKEYRLELHVHPTLADYLTRGTLSRLIKIQVKFFVKIKLVKDNNIAPDEFRFISIKQQKDITELYK